MMKLFGPNQMLCCMQGMSLHVGYRRFRQLIVNVDVESLLQLAFSHRL